MRSVGGNGRSGGEGGLGVVGALKTIYKGRMGSVCL